MVCMCADTKTSNTDSLQCRPRCGDKKQTPPSHCSALLLGFLPCASMTLTIKKKEKKTDYLRKWAWRYWYKSIYKYGIDLHDFFSFWTTFLCPKHTEKEKFQRALHARHLTSFEKATAWIAKAFLNRRCSVLPGRSLKERVSQAAATWSWGSPMASLSFT